MVGGGGRWWEVVGGEVEVKLPGRYLDASVIFPLSPSPSPPVCGVRDTVLPGAVCSTTSSSGVVCDDRRDTWVLGRAEVLQREHGLKLEGSSDSLTAQ